MDNRSGTIIQSSECCKFMIFDRLLQSYTELICPCSHVQNCNWGENYLLRKHAFHSRAPGVHTSSGNRSTVPNDFGRWVKERLPPRRLGKLMMSSRSWKTHNDPWRGVAKTAFGMDYMKAYTCEEDLERRRRSSEDEEWEEEGHGDKDRVLGLQGFDDHGMFFKFCTEKQYYYRMVEPN